MRNRKIQRWLKHNLKEKQVTLRDMTGVLDPTAYEAIKNIVANEKKDLMRRYYEAIQGRSELTKEDEAELQEILDSIHEDEFV